jgi:hypothetical protein
MKPHKIRLPKLVERDPRGPEVLRLLTTHTRPLWSAGVEVPTVELSSEFAEALRSAGKAGHVVRGLESAELALAAEERGLRLVQGAGNMRHDVRVSRLLVLTDDGADPGSWRCVSMWMRTSWASFSLAPAASCGC